MDEILKGLKSFHTYEAQIGYLKDQSFGIEKKHIEFILSQYDSRESGYYYLPDALGKIVEKIVKNKNPKKLLDPFAGPGLLLSDIPKMEKVGYESNKKLFELADLLNPKADIINKNFLEEDITSQYEAIIALSMPLGDRIKGYDYCIKKMLKLLVKEGILLFIIPNNFLTAPAYEGLRQEILKNYSLEFILKIPRTLKYANTFIDLNLVFIKNSPQREKVFLASYEENKIGEFITDYEGGKNELWVSSNNLLYRWDRNYHDPEFLRFEEELNKQDTKKLEELAEEIIPGILFDRSLRNKNGKYLVLTPGNLDGDMIVLSERDYYVNEIPNDALYIKRILRNGDILVSLLGPKIKTYIYQKNDPSAVANQNIAIIRAKDNKYIHFYLKSDVGKEVFLKQLKRRNRGGVIERVSISDLRNILIPILPFEELNRLVEEFDTPKPIQESSIVKMLKKELEGKGWEVKLEYRTNRYIIDIALFSQETLEAVIEIKNDSYINESLIVAQLREYKETLSADVYLFNNGTFYKLNENALIKIKNLPIPNSLYSKYSAMAANALTASAIAFPLLGPIGALGVAAIPLLKRFGPQVLSRINGDTVNLIKDKEILLKDKKEAETYGEEVKKYNEEILIELLNKINLVSTNVEKIEQTTFRTEQKIDKIIDILTDLKKEFTSIKQVPIEVEERIILLANELDKKIDLLYKNNENDIEPYIIIVKKWLSHEWDKLHELSKKYLPSAEYLFAKISKIPDADLSPFIIQYCRAFENEMLTKIFHNYLISLREEAFDIEKKFKWDFELKDNGKHNNENTFKAANYIKRCLSRSQDEWFFELGSIEINLRYVTGDMLSKSPFLSHFKKYLEKYFEKNIVEAEFLDKMKKIREEYRNKAAHPNIISLEEAQAGKQTIREMIITFLESYK